MAARFGILGHAARQIADERMWRVNGGRGRDDSTRVGGGSGANEK